MHCTNNLNDGYLGSGIFLRNSIRKYGKDNHLLQILEYFPSKELLVNKEKEIVNEQLLKDPLCMNLKIGGIGGAVSGERNQWFGKPAWNRGKKASEETIKKLSESHKGQVSWLKGTKGLIHPSEETKEKQRKALLGKPKPHKGHPCSEETKQKMRKPRGPMSEESKQKMRKPKIKRIKI
jgi:hypothetical protein